MKFKVGESREPRPVERQLGDVEHGIFIQSQPAAPDGFDLAWRLTYSSGESVTSAWTPRLEPSITKTVDGRSDIESVAILGRHRAGEFSVELLRVDWRLVKRFGYTSGSTSGNLKPGKDVILGMFVELSAGRQFKAWRNGQVMEVLK